MTVVVTGATGHVGANLVRRLLAQQRHVRVLIHINRKAVQGLDVEIAEGDVCDIRTLYDAFNGADVVYHLAARVSISMDDWPLLEQVNVMGTRNVVKACLHTGVRRLVHFSSIHALCQEPLDLPVDESRPLVRYKRCPPYDRSKAEGEKQVYWGIEQGLDAVIIIPTAAIGPYDYGPSHFGQALLALARAELPALVAGGFNWVDVRDVVEGAIRAEQHAPAGARYILSGHWVSVPELAAIVELATRVPAPRLVCPLWLAAACTPFTAGLARLTGKRPLYTGAAIKALAGNRNISHAKATRELGYNPRPFTETILDTLKWFADNGYLGR